LGDHPTAVVVGAGVFGAATTLALSRRGWRVTLIEGATPGHGAASSGGETRLLRSCHGPQPWYTALAWAARDGWLALGDETGTEVLVETGLVWFARGDAHAWEADSEAVLTDLSIPVERLAPDRVAELFPSVRTDDLAFGLWEPHAGVLRAAVGTRALVARAVALGAQVRVGVTGRPERGAVRTDHELLRADRVVWACGPWLPAVFGGRFTLSVTQQDACWFTAGPDWHADRVPAWVDFAGAAYGVGGLDGHGFKCSSDRQGPPFDPDADERVALPAHVAAARDILGHRFPGLAEAPLARTRTCQYTTTVDTEFLIAPLDDARVWIAGGGSGHAFKHGPALGEYVADLIDGTRPPDPRFGLGEREPAGSLRTAGHEG
jgi:glycine/D-amino acid oxidase-like deaminating enzyme